MPSARKTRTGGPMPGAVAEVARFRPKSLPARFQMPRGQGSLSKGSFAGMPNGAK